MKIENRPLYSLIYTSRSVRPFSLEEFDELLTKARETNGRLGLTGMLAHLGGNFIQVLEGNEEAVTELFHKKIAQDERHTTIEILTQGNIPKREFAEWTMAFKNLDNSVEERPEGFSDFVRKGFTSEIPADHRGLSAAILRNYRKRFGDINYPSPRSTAE